MSGKIIIFSGYAGSGKNTIINALLKRNKKLHYIPSVTTRNMRDGESEGNPYFFKTESELHELKEKGLLIESENIHGNWYGTLKSKYDEALNKKEIIIKDIDVNGAMEFKRRFGEKVFLVFIKPSNDFTVLDRMRNRGDSEEEIKIRKERIYYESSFIKYFDSVLVNDDLEVAIEKGEEIIKSIIKENKEVY